MKSRAGASTGRASALALLAVIAGTAAIPAAESFFWGPFGGFSLMPFFQPSPLDVPTYAGRTQVGGIYINAFPFTTPPAGRFSLGKALTCWKTRCIVCFLQGCTDVLACMHAVPAQPTAHAGLTPLSLEIQVVPHPLL